MQFIYYVIAFLAALVILWEAYTIFTRNKNVKVKGRDDPFFLMIALGVSMLLLAPQKEAVLATAIASIVVLAALLCTLLVKRGFTEEGMQKLFYLISYSDMKEAKMERVQMSRVKCHVITEGGSRSLLFLNKEMKDVVRILQKHGVTVYLDKELQLF